MPAPVQLLQSLLLQQLLITVTEAGNSEEVDAAAAGLQQYVTDVLQHLQEAAAVHEVLAVCLFQAAAASAALTGSNVASRWMSQLLLSLLRHDSSQPSFIQQQAAAVADQCWRGLALKHSSWRCIVSCMLACKLDVQGLLQQLQGCFVDAAASAQRLDRLCGVLTALRECSSSCREAVHEMLSAAVASALSQASQATLLPPLLVLQRLLHGSTDYSKVLEAAAVQALGPDSPNSGAAWCCLREVLMLHLQLPHADQALLQDHVQLLDQLKKSVSAAVQHSVVDTLGTLEGAAHQLKQQQQQQQQQGGTSSSIPPLSAGTLSTLEQFGQQARINGRRQLSDNHARSWGSAIQRRYLPEMCDAISLNVPGSAAEARLRWEFLMALQDCSLCSTVQVQQLVQTCAACGLDLNEGSAAAARQAAAAAADPVDILQQLLDRLPGAVAA
ncbi:hypothetical protein OEZ86_003848 [Tetradesmus obliquus]|nr:hypothetical protein OEZ86_003848 [Tetradesmus obliquus]